MFERSADLDVVYVPWNGLDPDEAVRLAVEWFHDQPGDRLVLLHAKSMIDNNPLLARLVGGAARGEAGNGLARRLAWWTRVGALAERAGARCALR